MLLENEESEYMKNLKKLLLLTSCVVILTGCNKKTLDDKGENDIIDKSEYTNPLICKSSSTTEYNTITEYNVYDYDKEGKNVLNYKVIMTYVYTEDQSEENKTRYEKWYNCDNMKFPNVLSCNASWTSNKEYKRTIEYTEDSYTSLSKSEIKEDPKTGFICE